MNSLEKQIEQNFKKHTCKSILDTYPSAPSSYMYYHITTTKESTALVYYDMEWTNCGEEGGWTRFMST